MSDTDLTLWVRGEPPAHDTIGTQTYGFWLYMMSDALIFAALFASYGVLDHVWNAAGGPTAHDIVHPVEAFWQTILLFGAVLSGSLAMAGMKRRSRKAAAGFLVVAALLGTAFVALELRDLITLVIAGDTPERSGYLSMFFLLVATHGLHIVFGLLWMGVMIVQVLAFGFTAPVVTRLLNMQMFWQFQAAIWVCVFVFVYLQGAM